MVETAEIIQAKIEGDRNPAQIRALNRLRELNINPELVTAAANAADGSPEFLAAEASIIREVMDRWSVDECSALAILNGAEQDHAEV